MPRRYFARIAVLQLIAPLCAGAALCCGLAALWICAAPTLGAAGALLAVAAILCAVGLVAFISERRSQDWRAPPPAPRIADVALLDGASSFFQQHARLALVAAIIAGVFLGWEN